MSNKEELTIEQRRAWNRHIDRIRQFVALEYVQIKDPNERSCPECMHPHMYHWDAFKGDYREGCGHYDPYDDEPCGCKHFRDPVVPEAPVVEAPVVVEPFWQGIVNLGAFDTEPHFAECRVVAVPGGTKCEVRVGSTDTWIAAQAEQAKCIWLSTRVPMPVARVLDEVLAELTDLEVSLIEMGSYAASNAIGEIIATLQKPTVFGVDVELMLSDMLRQEIEEVAALLEKHKSPGITNTRVLVEGGYLALKALSDKFEKAKQDRKAST